MDVSYQNASCMDAEDSKCDQEKRDNEDSSEEMSVKEMEALFYTTPLEHPNAVWWRVVLLGVPILPLFHYQEYDALRWRSGVYILSALIITGEAFSDKNNTKVKVLICCLYWMLAITSVLTFIKFNKVSRHPLFAYDHVPNWLKQSQEYLKSNANKSIQFYICAACCGIFYITFSSIYIWAEYGRQQKIDVFDQSSVAYLSYVMYFYMNAALFYATNYIVIKFEACMATLLNDAENIDPMGMVVDVQDIEDRKFSDDNDDNMNDDHENRALQIVVRQRLNSGGSNLSGGSSLSYIHLETIGDIIVTYKEISQEWNDAWYYWSWKSAVWQWSIAFNIAMIAIISWLYLNVVLNNDGTVELSFWFITYGFFTIVAYLIPVMIFVYFGNQLTQTFDKFKELISKKVRTLNTNNNGNDNLSNNVNLDEFRRYTVLYNELNENPLDCKIFNIRISWKNFALTFVSYVIAKIVDFLAF